MKTSNIIIVSNIKEAAKKILSKIVLLRSEDFVSACSYANIIDYLSVNTADLILVHVQTTQDTEIISKIKSVVKNTNVVLVVESENSDLICRAFDGGIDDYICIQTPDILFCMRVMWALERKYYSDSYDNKADILSLIKILDKKTEFYSKEYTNKILNKEYKSVLKVKDKSSYLVMLTCEVSYSISELAECVKKVMRNSDVAGFSQEERIYLILHNTSKDGVKKFFDRLKTVIGGKSAVFASALNINDKSYSESITVLNNLLVKACKIPNTLLFEDVNLSKETFKTVKTSEISNLLKNNPAKKIDKIITASFSKMFSFYEPKFCTSKIIQSVGKNKSTFIFKSNLCYAQLSLSYENPDNVSVEIDCIFHGKEKVEICEINADDLTAELIEKLIQAVALRYKKALDSKE